MIKSFTDHAANERTFLAWVRTGLAVIALGFLVDKFDLFLEIAAITVGGSLPTLTERELGAAAGLALIVVGTAAIVVGAARFLSNRKAIASDKSGTLPGAGMDVAMAVLIAILGCALALYLGYTVIAAVTRV